MISISNSLPALLHIHFTSQKLIRSKHRKGVPGIMVKLMPGALPQDAPDALLVLYQTEAFKTEKTVTNIRKIHLSTITMVTLQNCNSIAFSHLFGTKSTKKRKKTRKKSLKHLVSDPCGRGRRIRTRDPRFWSGCENIRCLPNACFFGALRALGSRI